MILNRRQIMASVAVAAAFPVSALAASNNPKRLLFIIQRGAADGVSTIMPVGDPDFARLRPQENEGTKLDSLFALHPRMTEVASMYAAKEAHFVHAVASSYRDRSHFDGQNILESGAARPYGRDDGWLNRLAGVLPSGEAKALAIAPSIPLLLRGPAEVASYAPSRLPEANDELMRRVTMLYAEDAALAPMWESALSTRDMAGMTMGGGITKGSEVGKMVAGLMAGPNGARIVSLETDGWDTHTGQANRLGNQLAQLDALIGAVKAGLGAEWKDTLVMVATEFGRTVKMNGTGGTDHGTASAAMLFGGSLSGGGTVATDWPGLSSASLYEGRDLRPTLRIETLISQSIAAHYAQDLDMLHRQLFPDFA